MAICADIILPLPLPGKYTYYIPDEMYGKIELGMRVYVQFGKKKFYTGIIDTLHDNVPSGYEVKPIMALLDDRPCIRYPQRKLWQWIADYYLCTIGEVYKAAVPAGLKIESETYVAINEDFEADESLKLTPADEDILLIMNHNKKMRLDELGKAAGIKGIGAKVSKLLQVGILQIDEKAVERYHAKKEKCIRLTLQRGDSEGLHTYFDQVSRSVLQQKVLVAYLDRSRWIQQREPLQTVTKKELLEATGVKPHIITALIKKGIFEEYTRRHNRFLQPDQSSQTVLSHLSESQQTALRNIHASMREHTVTLLHGVTGSGKTEIYSHLMQEALEAGSQVLYLVPEISLTTQLTDRLKRIFGDRLLVYHSKFNDSERVDIWNRILESTEPLIVLGVRSSIFLPFHHLGLVIVDEEHESSYKQIDPAPRYNARDAAIVLAGMHGAKTLLGSATPAVDTYYKASIGKYGLVSLTERFQGAVLPDVDIVDMKEQRKKKLNHGILSQPLRAAMHTALKSGRQGIMFQNRRGFAPYVVCKECGWAPKCVNCDVSMVYHKATNQLRCHYCGYTLTPTKVCPACGLNGIEVFGYGTERIKEELDKEFDAYRVARMDLDTTRNKDSYQQIIESFSNQETDILVGTQMVTKGLDFDKVNVVGVLNADTLLNFPDFRSEERAFNMLEQVSGRAGRRKDAIGKVIIQTTDPKHSVLKHVRQHDYQSYYADELADRKRYNYPPYTRIINIYLKHKEQHAVDTLAVDYTIALQRIFGDRVLGPEKPYVSRISSWYIQSIMLKIEANASMTKVKKILRDLYENMTSDARMRTAQIYYDVDPV